MSRQRNLDSNRKRDALVEETSCTDVEDSVQTFQEEEDSSNIEDSDQTHQGDLALREEE